MHVIYVQPLNYYTGCYQEKNKSTSKNVNLSSQLTPVLMSTLPALGNAIEQNWNEATTCSDFVCIDFSLCLGFANLN